MKMPSLNIDVFKHYLQKIFRRPQGYSAPHFDPENVDPHKCLMVVGVVGGRLEVYHNRIRIVRDGIINQLLELFGASSGNVDTTIMINRLSVVNISSPFLINDFVYFAYPGSPPRTGHHLRDATAENAFMLNFFDNRRVFDALELITELAEDKVVSNILLRKRLVRI